MQRIMGLSLLLILPVLAFAMRCQQSLVYEGDTKYIVEKKCGEPLAKEVYSDPQVLFNDEGAPYASTSITYEIWTYQKSPNDFMYELLFQDGVVKSITTKREP